MDFKTLTMRSGAGIVGPVAALLDASSNSNAIKNLDDFFSAELFLGMMGVALTAAGLLFVVSEQFDKSAIQIYLRYGPETPMPSEKKAEMKAYEQRSKDINKSSKLFVFSFVIALAGLFCSFGFDALLQKTRDPNSKIDLVGLIQSMADSSLSVDVLELVSSSGCFGLALYFMLGGSIIFARVLIAAEEKRQAAE